MLLASLSLVLFAAIVCDEPTYRIVTKRPDDNVVVTSDGNKSIFVVHSASGIGSAVIHRPVSGWPKSDIVLRLQLKGLEELRVTFEGIDWITSVSSTDKKSRVSVKKNGKETQITDANDQYWADVQAKVVYEVKLPKALFADNPESITVNWIDFYR